MEELPDNLVELHAPDNPTEEERLALLVEGSDYLRQLPACLLPFEVRRLGRLIVRPNVRRLP